MPSLKRFFLGSRIRIIVSLLLPFFILGLVIIFFFLGTGNPQENSTSRKVFEPDVYGEGNVLVTFEVKIPKWTPVEDKIYLYINNFYQSPGGGIPMKKKKAGVWSVAFKASGNEDLEYKYNRNNGGFATDEEFTPDSDKTWRKNRMGTDPLTLRDEVKKWRWLSEKLPNISLSKFEPTNLPEREKPFVMGVFMLDFFNEGFEDYISLTFKRIKEKGFDYVGVAYSAGVILNGNPLKITDKPINTYSEKQLDFTFKEARKNGLKLIFSSGVETDPTGIEKSFEDIEAQFQKKQSDSWYKALASEWEKAQVRAAKIAEKYKVEIFTPSDQWFVWGDKTESQKKMLNPLINNAYKNIRKVYSGKISSDSYNEDSAFDYYKQLDWIGDKWWWPIATQKKANLSEMRNEAQKIIDNTYKPIYERYKKPIFLQQLAYASYDGAAGAIQISTEDPVVAEWYPYNDKFPTDFQEQADAYEAVFQAIADETIFAGAVAFGYGYWDLQDKSAGIRSKPAEDVWVKWNKILSR